MGHTDQAPLPRDVGQAAPPAATDTPPLVALATHGFHDALAPCVHGTPCRWPHCRRHALLRGDQLLRTLSLWGMLALPLRRPGRLTPHLLHGGSRGRAVIAARRGRRAF